MVTDLLKSKPSSGVENLVTANELLVRGRNSFGTHEDVLDEIFRLRIKSFRRVGRRERVRRRLDLLKGQVFGHRLERWISRDHVVDDGT